MKSKYKQKLFRFFTALILAIVAFGFSVSSIAFSLIPNWTQEQKMTCFPNESPTEPIPAFIYGLSKKLERTK